MQRKYLSDLLIQMYFMFFYSKYNLKLASVLNPVTLISRINLVRRISGLTTNEIDSWDKCGCV